MAHGGVGNALYSDPPTYSNVIALGGTGDSAIWTGTCLAGEALRLMATGSADARDNIVDLVHTLHLWFNVTGQPGLLARYVAPAGDHPLVAMDCARRRIHCDVEHEGTRYDYSGHISRDQYQGVMLGYALAYEALGEHDEATRALIREDVVELVEELMIEREVPVRLTWDGTPIPTGALTMRFAVLAPDEMADGAIELIIDSGNFDDSEMFGFQEFIPNWRDVIRQIPLLSWVPSIPRSGSAVMLASFFRVALMVTDGIAGWEDRRSTMLDFYLHNDGWGGNVDGWLETARLWSYLGNCGDSYYANNIVMEPMYNLARLEDDPGRRTVIIEQVLERRMWPEFVDTKNVFFSFIYAANATSPEASVTERAVSQLSGFPRPPRIEMPVDLRFDDRYLPHEDGCSNQCRHDTAVDVSERVVSDFIWQRHPWGLLSAGNPSRTYPGVDYLAAYWMGRYHEFLEDDAPNRCLAWR